MEYGEQTLPSNDLFVYLPAQILPDLVVAMERQGFRPAQVKGGTLFDMRAHSQHSHAWPQSMTWLSLIIALLTPAGVDDA